MRVTRIERLLPELATRKDLAAAIAPLATKEELRTAVADLRGEVAALGSALRSEMTPRVFFEEMRDQMKVVMDAVMANGKAIEDLRQEMREGFRSLDRRVMRLEASAHLEAE